MKIAVIGSGIAGLSAAWSLGRKHEVTLFEREPRLGGHANTVDMPDGQGGSVPVDTGFIVYNTLNYPHLVRLFEALGVETHDSDMSFAISIGGGLTEYFGDGPGMFAQRRNIFRPSHWQMIRDILRFYREAPSYLATAEQEGLSIGALLDRHGYGHAFRYRHLLPMAGAIWSTPVERVGNFPAAAFISFFDNHRLFDMDLKARPVWRTVTGGSRRYVQRVAEDFTGTIRTGCPVRGVERDPRGVTLAYGEEILDKETFDEVVFACHPDETRAILGRETDKAERLVLEAIPYGRNRAILHTDTGQMPRRRRAWASWNYIAAREARHGDEAAPVALTYWMNQLQGIETKDPALLTLNPVTEPDPDKVVGEWWYDHPQFSQRAMEAQATLGDIQGRDRLWFCGAWCGHGFHEDGAASGLAVASALGAPAPWARDIREMSPAAANATPRGAGITPASLRIVAAE